MSGVSDFLAVFTLSQSKINQNKEFPGSFSLGKEIDVIDVKKAVNDFFLQDIFFFFFTKKLTH